MENEEEQILQDLLRQKLNGSSEISPLPAGELMECFQTELAILNEEFTHFREGFHYILWIFNSLGNISLKLNNS